MIAEVYYNAGAADAWASFVKEAGPRQVMVSTKPLPGAPPRLPGQPPPLPRTIPQGSGNVFMSDRSPHPTGAPGATGAAPAVKQPLLPEIPYPSKADRRNPGDAVAAKQQAQDARVQRNLEKSRARGGGQAQAAPAAGAPAAGAPAAPPAGAPTAPPAGAPTAPPAGAPAAGAPAAGAPDAGAAPAPGFWQSMKEQAPSALLNTGLMMGVPMLMNAFSNSGQQQNSY